MLLQILVALMPPKRKRPRDDSVGQTPASIAQNNVDVAEVEAWRERPENRWRALPNENGNVRDGRLPMDWEVKEKVVALIRCVNETKHDCNSARRHVWISRSLALRTHWQDQIQKLRADAVRSAIATVPNMTTLQYILQTGVVQQHLASAPALQVALGCKTIEIDFRCITESARMKVAATTRHVAFWGYCLVPTVVAIGWPRPYASFHSVVEAAGGIAGVLSVEYMPKKYQAMPLEMGVQMYLADMRPPSTTTAVRDSARVQTALEHCRRQLETSDPGGLTPQTASLWGYTVSQPLWPFVCSESEAWDRVVRFSQHLEAEWRTMGAWKHLPPAYAPPPYQFPTVMCTTPHTHGRICTTCGSGDPLRCRLQPHNKFSRKCLLPKQ